MGYLRRVLFTSQLYTRREVRSNRDCIFLYGDNELRKGKGGSAIIRDESNAVGIRTKVRPSKDHLAYWYDDEYNQHVEMIKEDFRKVIRELKLGKVIVIPASGLGTGRAQLPKRAPRTFKFLKETTYLLVDIAGGKKICI